MNIKSIIKKTFLYKLYVRIKRKKFLFENNIIINRPKRNCLNKSKRKERVIISITSFPARIPYINKVILSILNQTFKPDKIVLWLAKPQFPNQECELPKALLSLCQYGLEIAWVEKDLKSYKKLLPALKNYPDDIIVTADDDVYWKKNCLEILMSSFEKEPAAIHCHNITRIQKVDGHYDSIKKTEGMKNSVLYCNKLVGNAGVLYPPHCLDQEVFNEKKMLELAPTSDDIWFWCMALKNNTKICWVEHAIEKIIYVEGTQENTPCLHKVNDIGGEKRPFLIHLNLLLNEYALGHLLDEEFKKE